MLNSLGKSLNLCFTKIRLTPPNEAPPSITHGHGHPSLFIKTFNSLFDQTYIPNSSPNTTPDFATAIASRRFFFSSPGRSNSIIDSSSPSLSLSSSSLCVSPEAHSDENVVAVPTYSPDPYKDFRRSMEEMAEARGLSDVRENWEELHELLTCYLTLNPKCTHKFVMAAFADLLVSLMSDKAVAEPGSVLENWGLHMTISHPTIADATRVMIWEQDLQRIIAFVIESLRTENLLGEILLYKMKRNVSGCTVFLY